jgi:glycosyltransferase involved in cell wall biosynthesis
VDVFLTSVAQFRRMGSPVEAVIAGSGPERERLQSMVESLGIGEDVSFLGNVADVTQLYAQLDLVVLPSRSEGLPNVLLEAIQADLPVVATAVGAIPEVLTDRACGELVRPDDADALFQAMRRVLAKGRDPATAEARSQVRSRFSLDTRVERHLDLYADVLFGESSRARRFCGATRVRNSAGSLAASRRSG